MMRNSGKFFLLWTAATAVCGLVLCICEAMAQDAPARPPGAGPQAAPAPDEPPPGEGGDEKRADPAPVSSGGLLGQFESVAQAVKLEGLWTQNSWSNWLIFLVSIFLGLLAGKIAAVVLGNFGRRFEHRGWRVWNHLVVDLVGPAKLGLLALGLSVGLAFLGGKSAGLSEFTGKTLLLLFSIVVFWYAYNLVSVVDLVLRRFTAKTESVLDDQIVPLIRKTLRVFVVVVGTMFVVDSVFDQDIGALLAGLGIAGLAVSLAAQDSLKNLFGSITILLDRPFQIGERIIYAGYDGVIEEIGFRSTKLRTLTDNVVTIPNSAIVNEAVENVARRRSIRRIMDVTITYDTPREKIEQAVQILRDILEEEDLREPIHQTIKGDEFPPRVYFNDFNSQSLNIRVIYWYIPPAYWDFLDHAQRLNLRIFSEFEKAGIEFAFPTQTLLLAGDPKRELAIRMLGKDLEPPR
ncbi:MAG: mechanosensitive ion channel family protein [Pirellulales bacterium]|nr:mechanosensitive ion channel family protein [Pirellulales bacterium]